MSKRCDWCGKRRTWWHEIRRGRLHRIRAVLRLSEQDVIDAIRKLDPFKDGMS